MENPCVGRVFHDLPLKLEPIPSKDAPRTSMP